MTTYKSNRIIDGKSRKVIVNDNGKIINRNPSKDELKNLKTFEIAVPKQTKKYTDEQLLNYLRRFFEKKGRTPIEEEFVNNPEFPSFGTYQNRFGSWNCAIIKAGLDINFGGNKGNKYKDEEMISSLRKFSKEYRRVPTEEDLTDNPDYPSYITYLRHFGTWNNALKKAGLDRDTLIKKGILKDTRYKGRLFELYILEHFKKESAIDLSGKNCNSPFDGICPNGMTYDAKSSSFNGSCWTFGFTNKEHEKIKWYYLGGFDKDYKNLLYILRIPGTFVDNDSYFNIGLNCRYMYNLENMKEFDITDKFDIEKIKKIIFGENDNV